MREKTVYAAVCAIVERQKLFFYKGPGHLRPLRMKDIAEAIGVHETTVSRIANGKYLQCEWGLFEFKYFFTNAVSQKDTPSAQDERKSGAGQSNPGSKESVKHLLKIIIDKNEQKGIKKLSDAKLAELLEAEGVRIARRTVAKYRSELNIESSFDRS